MSSGRGARRKVVLVLEVFLEVGALAAQWLEQQWLALLLNGARILGISTLLFSPTRRPPCDEADRDDRHARLVQLPCGLTQSEAAQAASLVGGRLPTAQEALALGAKLPGDWFWTSDTWGDGGLAVVVYTRGAADHRLHSLPSSLRGKALGAFAVVDGEGLGEPNADA